MRRRELVALGLALALPRRAVATVLVHRSLEALLRAADAVVFAVPRTRRAAWLAGRIETTVTVEVLAPLAGAVPQGAVLAVKLPGGTVGDLSQRLEGTPALATGVPVVLLLEPEHNGARAVLNLSAGVLPVTAHTPPRVLPARTAGITFLPDPSPGWELPSEGIEIIEFSARVRTLRR
jgi:hypothetical protein